MFYHLHLRCSLLLVGNSYSEFSFLWDLRVFFFYLLRIAYDCVFLLFTIFDFRLGACRLRLPWGSQCVYTEDLGRSFVGKLMLGVIVISWVGCFPLSCSWMRRFMVKNVFAGGRYVVFSFHSHLSYYTLFSLKSYILGLMRHLFLLLFPTLVSLDTNMHKSSQIIGLYEPLLGLL